MECLCRLEVGEVVDVAVQDGGDIRARLIVDLVGVEWVGIGLADDADAGPTRVAQDDRLDLRCTERLPQEGVGHDRGAKCARVVTEFTDLGSGLVDETQMTFGSAHGHRTEERVGCTIGDDGAEGRR